jgi:hypothetical protein
MTSLTKDANDAIAEIEKAMAECAEQLGHGCPHCQALAFGVRAIKDRMTMMRGLLEITDRSDCPPWIQAEVGKTMDRLERTPSETYPSVVQEQVLMDGYCGRCYGEVTR